MIISYSCVSAGYEGLKSFIKSLSANCICTVEVKLEFLFHVLFHGWNETISSTENGICFIVFQFDLNCAGAI